MKYIKPIICVSAFLILSMLLSIRAGQGDVPHLFTGGMEYTMAALATLCGLFLTHHYAGTRFLLALKLLAMIVFGGAIVLAGFAMAGRMDLLINLHQLSVAVSVAVVLSTGICLLLIAAVLVKEALPERAK